MSEAAGKQGSAGSARGAAPGRRKPDWLKVKAPAPRQYRATGALLDELELHTVCAEARCPNKGECFASGTATFLILGDVCTRACAFCAVEGEGKARPAGSSEHATGQGGASSSGSSFGVCALDGDEPRRVAEAAWRLGLRHVVITSVTRDDLPDGGAAQFAAAIAAVRAATPEATVEVLVPDLGGDEAALRAVLAARPDVLNHNLETVSRLYPTVRPQARYGRSLELLARAASWARSPRHDSARPLVKTGLMVGVGETAAEVGEVLADAAAAGVDAVTVGQYLQPRAGCLAVARYVAPKEFEGYERTGAALGLTVVAAPFVRSSYRAGELLERGA
ncbi:MAG TPA: lipoyl synthase [Thermoleophilia bacterium]|nr:lipoyl synthase [Thermoleophilia bacterium]